jgi:Glyoxalase-like domain
VYGGDVRIDHVIYAARDLGATARRFEEEYGLASSGGGVHPKLGTCNTLVPVGNGQYIELMAVADPERTSYLVEGLVDVLVDGDRLFAVSIAPDDLVETASRLGIPVTQGERRSTTGRLIRWRMAALPVAASPSRLPFFVDWGDSDAELDLSLNPGVHGIEWIELGGEEEAVRQWVGDAGTLPFRFADGPPGPVALGLRKGTEILVVT